MTKQEKMIARILDDLIKFSCVKAEIFLNDFKVSESTLRRYFKKVTRYIAYEDVVNDTYGIDSAIELKLYINDVTSISSYIANDNDPINYRYLENIFSQINKLPKRQDLKYKEIEKFRDFETTYSLVNEMAIRNKKVLRYIKVFHKLAFLQDAKHKKYNDYKLILKTNQSLNEKTKIKYKTYIESYNIDSKKSTIDGILNILKNEYMISPLECQIDEINYSRNQKYSTLIEQNIYDTQSVINGRLKLNTNVFDSIYQNGKFSKPKKENYDGFILEQQKYTTDRNFLFSIIKPSFSRNIVDNNVTTLSINFSLPEEEILKYISHIKNALYPNKQVKRIKTPEELTLGDDYSSTFRKLNKSDIADYFFIYDFIIKRKEILKTKYEQSKIEQIEYDEDIKKEHLESIFRDPLLRRQLKSLDKSTIKMYYYTMYNYINKLQYRELVNSAFYKPKNGGDLRQFSTQDQQNIRKKVIKGIEQKLAVKQIAKLTGMSISRIYALKKQYKNTDNTLAIKKRGRVEGTKKLSVELEEKILDELANSNKLWNKYSVKAMISKKFDKELSISSIINYLKSKQINFDNSIPYKYESITIKEWIELNFPNIKDEAKQENAIICWSDIMWKQKIDKVYLTKLVIYPKNKFMFCLDHKYDIYTIIDFFKNLIKQFDQKIYLITGSFDSFQADEKVELLEFQQKYNKKLQFFH